MAIVKSPGGPQSSTCATAATNRRQRRDPANTLINLRRNLPQPKPSSRPRTSGRSVSR